MHKRKKLHEDNFSQKVNFAKTTIKNGRSILHEIKIKQSKVKKEKKEKKTRRQVK